MKKLSLIIGCLFVSSVLVAQSDSTQIYDLGQCIQYAFDHQQDVQNATLDIQNAEYQKKEAIGAGLPQVHGRVQTLDNFNIQKQFLPANAFDPSAPENVIVPVGFGVKYTNDINITATQLLFDGSYLAGVKASKVYVELFSKSLTRTKVDVVENVTKAYCGVLVSHERVKILDRDKKILEELIIDTRARYESGFAEEIDVQRLEVQLNNILVDLANLIAFEEVSYKILMFQMGMDVNSKITVSGDLEELFEKAINKDLPNPDAKNRIEYKVLETNRKVDEINVNYNVAQGLPRLSLFGSAGYNTGANQTGELFKSDNYYGYSNIGLKLDVPIFQGLSKTHRVNQAKISLQKTRLDMAKFELSVGLEYAQAKANFDVNLKKINFHKKNIELAENVSKTTRIKYAEGVGSNYELTDAVSSYLDAQTNYYIAIYDAMLSYIELQKALGVLYQEGKE
jgi:outer membrane protein TolC